MPYEVAEAELESAVVCEPSTSTFMGTTPNAAEPTVPYAATSASSDDELRGECSPGPSSTFTGWNVVKEGNELRHRQGHGSDSHQLSSSCTETVFGQRFSKNADERHQILEERKRQLVEDCRNAYIAKSVNSKPTN